MPRAHHSLRTIEVGRMESRLTKIFQAVNLLRGITDKFHIEFLTLLF